MKNLIDTAARAAESGQYVLLFTPSARYAQKLQVAVNHARTNGNGTVRVMSGRGMAVGCRPDIVLDASGGLVVGDYLRYLQRCFRQTTTMQVLDYTAQQWEEWSKS